MRVRHAYSSRRTEVASTTSSTVGCGHLLRGVGPRASTGVGGVSSWLACGAGAPPVARAGHRNKELPAVVAAGRPSWACWVAGEHAWPALQFIPLKGKEMIVVPGLGPSTEALGPADADTPTAG